MWQTPLPSQGCGPDACLPRCLGGRVCCEHSVARGGFPGPRPCFSETRAEKERITAVADQGGRKWEELGPSLEFFALPTDTGGSHRPASEALDLGRSYGCSTTAVIALIHSASVQGALTPCQAHGAVAACRAGRKPSPVELRSVLSLQGLLLLCSELMSPPQTDLHPPYHSSPPPATLSISSPASLSSHSLLLQNFLP